MVKTKVLSRDVKNNSINNIQQGTDRKGQHLTKVAVAQPLFSGSIGKNARNMTSSEAILGRFLFTVGKLFGISGGLIRGL